MNRNGLVLVIGFMMALPIGLRAQDASGEQGSARANEVTELYRRLLTADAERDTTALKQILAPTYRFITPRGDTVLTRADRVAIASRDTSRGLPRALHGCQVQFYDPSAVAQCRYTGTVRAAAGDSTVNFVSLVVFNRRGGRWQIVASHPAPVRPRPVANQPQ